eukprot:CAMPEP_0114575132 /NCGR_PEP_ID=MMETSP0125-20121206/35_1 /TAXON_ID=485358 ORGANISM="Aristerostoma sp., Strain ATCC 50986" /NCGR_SAMPLE_ID=MMETSP0125 /ASSEMBLY_ACC=CAM_ASM_000245 /LENGTH=74 /DNA_ID=CAMNT_0001762623 /DNA_START=1090 /DNA_END=1311 /DNA_ORIENTATION=-
MTRSSSCMPIISLRSRVREWSLWEHRRMVEICLMLAFLSLKQKENLSFIEVSDLIVFIIVARALTDLSVISTDW